MKPTRQHPAIPPLDQAAIDAEYGLEPIIDPAREGHRDGESEPMQFTLIQCPYCGEPFETPVDASGGSCSYIEDCQVCCRPIEIGIDVSSGGALRSVTAQRSD